MAIAPGAFIPARKGTVNAAPDPLATIGNTGLKKSGGHILEEYLRDLKGDKAVQIYQEIADSPLGAAFLLFVRLIAQRVEWKAKPANDSPEAEAEAKQLDDALADIDIAFKQVVGVAVSAAAYGWCRQEIVYKVRRGPLQTDPSLRSDFNDGRWGWRDFAPRSQDSKRRWIFKRDADGRETNELEAMEQYVQGDSRGTYVVPESKMLAAVLDDDKRSPEGRSMFRPGVGAFWRSRSARDIEMIGLERDLAGMPVFELPHNIMTAAPGTDAARVRAEYETAVQLMRRNRLEGLVFPASEDRSGKTGYNARLMASGGQGRISADTTIQREDKLFLMSMLFELQALGNGTDGANRALGEVKYNVVQLAVAGLLDAVIVRPMNQKAIPDLWRMNGVPDELWPSLEVGQIIAPTLEELTELLVKMTQGGVIAPAQDVEDYLVSKLPGFPERTKPTPTAPVTPDPAAAAPGSQQAFPPKVPATP